MTDQTAKIEVMRKAARERLQRFLDGLSEEERAEFVVPTATECPDHAALVARLHEWQMLALLISSMVDRDGEAHGATQDDTMGEIVAFDHGALAIDLAKAIRLLE